MKPASRNSLKNEMLHDYVREHPETNEAAVVSRTRNGRVELDTFQTVTKDIRRRRELWGKRRNLDFTVEGIPREVLVAEPRERAEACGQSLEHTQRYLGWFDLRLMDDGTRSHRNAYEMKMASCEQQLAEAVQRHEEQRSEISAMMKDRLRISKPVVIQQKLIGLLDSMQHILSMQVRILELEYGISQETLKSLGQGISQNYPRIKQQVSAKSRVTVLKTFRLLQHLQADEVPELNAASFGELDGAMNDAHLCLNSRMEMLERAEKVFLFIDRVLERDEDENSAVANGLPEEVKTAATRGMHYLHHALGIK